jgi:hypothetical protein
MSFILSKILWLFLSPGNLCVMVFLGGGFLGQSVNEKRRKIGQLICFYAALVFFIVSVTPFVDWILTPIENMYPPETPARVDGIIVIGGDEKTYLSQERGQPIVLDSARRYIKFAALAREYPNAKLVFSGGSGLLKPEATLKDAEVARQSLESIGVPVDKMIFEDESRNTHENAEFSAKKLQPTPQQNWLLVTSAFHMPRAIGCFKKAGFNVYPATVGYMTDGHYDLRLSFDMSFKMYKLFYAVHEYYGLVAYWLMGYIDWPWPK